MNRIKVLLADDHTLYREGTRSVIERKPDLKVIGEARDEAETIKLASELLPHVILMDITLPKVDSAAVIRRIKTACRTAAILILTADENDRQTADLLEAGAAGCLLKNIDGAGLVNAIHAVHAGGAALQSAAAQKTSGPPGANERRSPDSTREFGISEREMEVLKLAAGGMSNRDIAARLGLSRRTVQAHLANIYRKIDVGSRTEAVLKAMSQSWRGFDDLP